LAENGENPRKTAKNGGKSAEIGENWRKTTENRGKLAKKWRKNQDYGSYPGNLQKL
jgi:hypothetical protein